MGCKYSKNTILRTFRKDGKHAHNDTRRMHESSRVSFGARIWFTQTECRFDLHQTYLDPINLIRSRNGFSTHHSKLLWNLHRALLAHTHILKLSFQPLTERTEPKKGSYYADKQCPACGGGESKGRICDVETGHLRSMCACKLPNPHFVVCVMQAGRKGAGGLKTAFALWIQGYDVSKFQS